MTTLASLLDQQIHEREQWETSATAVLTVPTIAGSGCWHAWMSACLVDRALGIHSDTPVYGGDCHLFRNAGGIVTDDAIRSAALTCNFFGTREIVVLQHTECGMLSKNAADLETHFRDRGVDIDHLQVDPSLPELKLEKGAFAKWLGMFDDVDQTTIRTVEYIRNHPLIPKDVTVSGYVWEVENQRLRKPNPGSNTGRERTSSTRESFGVHHPQPTRWV